MHQQERLSMWLQDLLRHVRPAPAASLEPQVLALLEQLAVFPWFSQVGQPLPSSEPVQSVSSWAAALTHAKSPGYSDMLLEAANAIRKEIFQTNAQSAREWNTAVVTIKHHTEPLLADRLRAAPLLPPIRTSITGIVQWDLVHSCLALHFHAHHSSTYYERLLEWYLRGHFPCGWVGDYPNGHFIVY